MHSTDLALAVARRDGASSTDVLSRGLTCPWQILTVMLWLVICMAVGSGIGSALGMVAAAMWEQLTRCASTQG